MSENIAVFSPLQIETFEIGIRFLHVLKHFKNFIPTIKDKHIVGLQTQNKQLIKIIKLLCI